MNYQQFLEKSWLQYIDNTPSAKAINDLLKRAGEKVENDHIAFRTWADNSKVSIKEFMAPFLDWGLVPGGEYYFERKKVRAIHLQHPTDHNVPKVFISEIMWKEFSSSFQKITNQVLEQIPSNKSVLELFDQKVCWKQTISEYDLLAKESEYGAWLYAWGIRPNHFTVSINALKKYNEITQLNSFLKANNFLLNSSGGEVKGSAQILLEQSSIMADNRELNFIDGKKSVPSCYYEFAKRYVDKSGKLYQGFNEKSADKIFESTNARS